MQQLCADQAPLCTAEKSIPDVAMIHYCLSPGLVALVYVQVTRPAVVVHHIFVRAQRHQLHLVYTHFDIATRCRPSTPLVLALPVFFLMSLHYNYLPRHSSKSQSLHPAQRGRISTSHDASWPMIHALIFSQVDDNSLPFHTSDLLWRRDIPRQCRSSI